MISRSQSGSITIASGVTVPLPFLNLFDLSPSALANALSQLSGQAGTAVAPAGIQAMDSFLSVVSNPFVDTRADARFLARLGQRGDHLQEWGLARRPVQHRVSRGLADLQRVLTAALYVVSSQVGIAAARTYCAAPKCRGQMT
jgi:hypothetical protein